ncbi:MAG: hypothetical protein E7384_01220 [Ruminococcaceae bacterium]|nr:hypothetical protein [Oscillospiraceae bacterium]
MFFLDLIVDMIIYGWLELMQWIIPKKINKKAQIALKVIVWIVSIILLFFILLGVFGLLISLISSDLVVRKLSLYFIFIPLGISLIQIIFGIVIRAVKNKR